MKEAGIEVFVEDGTVGRMQSVVSEKPDFPNDIANVIDDVAEPYAAATSTPP